MPAPAAVRHRRCPAVPPTVCRTARGTGHRGRRGCCGRPLIGLVALLCLYAVIGCGARGPRYAESAAASASIPLEHARLVFFRTCESPLYIARRAAITIDGRKVGAAACDGFFVRDVTRGRHVISAGMWDAPGRCELALTAAAPQTYYFQVDPRAESFGAFAVAGFAASLLTGGVLSDLAGGLAGSALESYGQSCAGAFRLYPVDPETALRRLAELRHTP